MRKMKLDEDLKPDREDEFLTDDEENQAETDCEHFSNTESDSNSHSTHAPIVSDDSSISEDNSPSWPQSYRESTNLRSLASSSITLPKQTSFATIITSVTSVCKRRKSSDQLDSFLSKPLNETSFPTSTLPVRLTASASSYLKISVKDLSLPENQSSFGQAVLNGTNILCGLGLLTTPYAVKEGGWLSLLILFFFGVICCYTGILLKKCLESSPRLHTYPDIGEAAFGAVGRLVISIALYLELYATCVEYLVMISDNLSRMFPNTSVNFAGINFDSHQIFSITATLIILPTVWLRDLSILAYLSVGGVVASILMALCLLWVGVVDKVGFHPSGTALELAKLPVAVGIYGFGYSGHSVFPNIYSSMKDPSGFSSVLIVSFIFCWFMYTGVAICGFLMFGNSIESQFTLNMPTGFAASKIAIWTAIFNPITKYALTITPVALSLEELMPSGRLRSSYSASLVVRTILVFSTLVVACTVPFFGTVMALMGSFLAMLIAVIVPCVCYLILLRERLTSLQIAACFFTITVGLLSGCIGTYSSIVRLLHKSP